MYGVIDIGSNTIRMSFYEVINNEIKLMFSKKDVAGLAGYVENGELSNRGIEKAISVLDSFKKIIENINVDEVFVFATASLRNIQNTKQAVEAIKNQTGFDVRVLSGGDEAFYGYLGGVRSTKNDSGIVIDIGGGSTELVFYKNHEILIKVSMPVGSFNMYSKFVSGILPTKEESKAIQKAVLSELKKITLFENSNLDTDMICGVGGTMRAACKMNNDIFNLPKSNRSLSCESIKKILNKLSVQNKETLLYILQIVPERIHTIVPGMTIMRTIIKFYESKNITVSEYGVREGYLYNILKERGEIDG